jgi:hypothetical protein
MNFPETESLAEAEFLAPQPALVTEEDRRRHRTVQRRLAIAERSWRSDSASSRRTSRQRSSYTRRRGPRGGWRARTAAGARPSSWRRSTARRRSPTTTRGGMTCGRTLTRPPPTTRSSAARSLGSAQFNFCCLLLSSSSKTFFMHFLDFCEMRNVCARGLCTALSHVWRGHVPALHFLRAHLQLLEKTAIK